MQVISVSRQFRRPSASGCKERLTSGGRIDVIITIYRLP